MSDRLRTLFADDTAVSPVIGVILMVAVTVVLAAVIGTFVMGIGNSVDPAPQNSFEVEEKSGDVVISQDGGKALAESDLTVKVDGSTVASGDLTWNTGSDSNLDTGESVTVDSSVVGPDETITLVWTSSDGTGYELTEWTAP